MFPDGDSLCLGRPGERWGTNWREGEGEGGGSSTIRYAQSQSAAFRWAPAAGSPERRDQSSSQRGGGVVRRIGGAFSLCSRASWNRSILPCDGAGAGAEVAGGPDGTDGGGAGRHLCTAAGNERGGRHQRQSLALHYDQDRLVHRRQLPL